MKAIAVHWASGRLALTRRRHALRLRQEDGDYPSTDPPPSALLLQSREMPQPRGA